MQEFEIKNEKEKLQEKILLRKGDIITPIGIFRAAMINNGYLEREQFNLLVKKNYFLEKKSELPEHLSQKITQEWNNLKKYLEDLKIIEEFGENKIKIRYPDEFFSI